MGIVYRIVAAIVAGVVAWLVCVFIGGLIEHANGPAFLSYAGNFLVLYAVLIGILVALWVFVSGWVPQMAFWRQAPPR